jgi:farnesyl diphosphate synthase
VFAERLEAARARVQAGLDAAMAPLGDGPVTDAMRYASEGGKRLREFLAIEAAALHDVPAGRAIRPAMAIECVHAYSLVHDDLPCMDDDALRRGRPTVHVRWDEATAVLAGDALQTLAFEILAAPETHPDGAVRAELCLTLARAAGADGMVRGQALDIAAESAGAPLDIVSIAELQRLKTGRLLEWPCEAGARLAGADPGALRDYARALGLAFQIADDILDVVGDAEATGKAVGKDAEAGKATFVGLLGLEGAKARADALAEEAADALSPYGARASSLIDTARFVVSRDR